MLLNSPIFIFLFLPLSLGIYGLTPKSRKQEVLFIICVAYYMLVNLKNPFAVSLLAVNVFFVWLMARAIERARKLSVRRFLLIVSVALVVCELLILRISKARELFPAGIAYPLGAAIWTLSAISCIVDVYRGDAEKPMLFDIASYLCFFPVMIAGPIIKFKDSRRIFSNIDFSFDSFASGAKHYMIGFIKRIAVGAVLYEAYVEIVSRSGNELSLPIALVLAIIISTDIYAVFSGYSDMASGVAQMFGLRLPENFDNQLTASTPNQYIERFMTTLYDFVRDYVLDPLSDRRPRSLRGFAAVIVMGELLVMWYRLDLSLIIMTLPLVLLAAIIYFTCLTKLIDRHWWSRVPCRILTFVIMAMFWFIVRLPRPMSFFDYAWNFSSLHDYKLLAIFGSASVLKYLTVLVIGILSMIPVTRIGRAFKARVRGRSDWIDPALTLFIMLGFIFTVMFFMPQYPQYAADPLFGLQI